MNENGENEQNWGKPMKIWGNMKENWGKGSRFYSEYRGRDEWC